MMLMTHTENGVDFSSYTETTLDDAINIVCELNHMSEYLKNETTEMFAEYAAVFREKVFAVIH